MTIKLLWQLMYCPPIDGDAWFFFLKKFRVKPSSTLNGPRVLSSIRPNNCNTNNQQLPN
jgi:hypothetical protein